MLTNDELDKLIYRAVSQDPAPLPSEKFIDDATRCALLYTQAQPLKAAQRIDALLTGLISPWPENLYCKAGVMCVVIVIMFGAGLHKGLQTQTDRDVINLSIFYGDTGIW